MSPEFRNEEGITKIIFKGNITFRNGPKDTILIGADSETLNVLRRLGLEGKTPKMLNVRTLIGTINPEGKVNGGVQTVWTLSPNSKIVFTKPDSELSQSSQ